VYARKVDANQAEIVKTLRKMGASVQSLRKIGQGCPDLLCGWRQKLFLFEVKDGSKPPSARELTEDEKRWIAAWRSPVHIITSALEAEAFLLMVKP
jgi:hypothetical protein